MSQTGTFVVVLFSMAVAVPLTAQTPAVRATLGGRLHYQWNATSVDEAEAGAAAPIARSTFEARRVRLSADVQVGEWIRGRIEPEVGMARLGLRQAWVSFALDPAVLVRAGQFKKPFGLIQLTSSAEFPLIERSVRIRGLDDALLNAEGNVMQAQRGVILPGEQHALLDVQQYVGYDMGVAVEGARGAVGWSVGVFNGSGPDARDENDAKSVAGRVTWQVPGSTALKLGAGWSRRELNWPSARDSEQRAGSAWGMDVELGGFRRGVWVLAEAVTGTNLVAQERFAGVHVAGAWFRPTGGERVEGWEPAARVSWGDPDRTVAGDAGVLVTPGVNLYFIGRNRLMLNWDVYVPQGEQYAVQHAARAQVNLHF